MEELKNAATVRALSKHVTVALCVHGINTKYCKTCLSKKPAKASRAKQSAPAEAKSGTSDA